MARGGTLEEPRFDLVVAGHTNIDRFLRVERLPERDRTVPLLSERAALGGTAATFARLTARSGVRVALVSRVGSDFPEQFVAELRRDGVDLNGLERVEDARSPACYILEDTNGGQVTLIHQGPMGDTDGAVIPEEVLGGAHWLHLTTGHPRYQLRLKEAARAHGVRVAVDPAQEVHYLWTRALLEELLDGAEMFFGNEAELARALQLLHLHSAEDLLDRVPLLVITRGARGARAVGRTGAVSVPAVRAGKVHSATGAGDAFRAGFYEGFFQGLPLLQVLQRGNRTAADWVRAAPERARASAPAKR